LHCVTKTFEGDDAERIIEDARHELLLNYNPEYDGNNYPRLYGQRDAGDELIDENASDGSDI
jgi:hypothetical protein